MRQSLGTVLEDVIKAADDAGPDVPVRMSWVSGDMSVEVDLQQPQWQAVRRHLGPSSGVTQAEATVMRFLNMLKHTERPCRYLARMARSRALGLMRWYDDGILLPFGHARDGFNMLNPYAPVGPFTLSLSPSPPGR